MKELLIGLALLIGGITAVAVVVYLLGIIYIFCTNSFSMRSVIRYNSHDMLYYGALTIFYITIISMMLVIAYEIGTIII